jgi:antitoxin PrlF
MIASHVVHYRGNMLGMSLARSRLTCQGQISIPAEVRRRLGIGPGSVLEWDEDGGAIIVRRSGRFSCADVHGALFGSETPAPRTLAALKAGVRQHVRSRHARD